ncbi:DgyrCDS11715 [Dimorphilus gyrociliatus]|uniref:DgyrCDS11715 n=1 Tax=Dimorphilus gyrociliatus TaxID=2664684 RepID=A0A7I8W889_9ANNE|nr:DgyrCDS11715 [Dimorphilus gyrociliatus]
MNSKEKEVKGKGEGKEEDRFRQILRIINDNVSYDWRIVAKSLKFSKIDIADIEKTSGKVEEQSWNMLTKWRGDRKLNGRILNDILDALKECRFNRLADLTTRIAFSQSSIDDILALHVEREIRMRDILLKVTDNVHNEWRRLAVSLRLNKADIAKIETSFSGRTREKCMRALYKWRSLVGLQEYKASSVIRALKECGLQEAANEISRGPICETRRRKKGELLVQLRGESDDKDKAFKNYALNKVLLRLLDALEEQDKIGTHPIVSLFQDNRRVILDQVSRVGAYLSVICSTKSDVRSLYELYKSGELQAKVNEILVTDDIMEELGGKNFSLKVSISEQEQKLCEGELPLKFDNSMNEYFEALPSSRTNRRKIDPVKPECVK